MTYTKPRRNTESIAPVRTYPDDESLSRRDFEDVLFGCILWSFFAERPLGRT